MTLYELLSTLTTNIKTVITKDENIYEVYSNSVDGLDEFLKDSQVKSWEINRNVVNVLLENIVSA
jgi:hypothetical protein